jgi:HPt (histidine-containing phosphotransfer) domain-containing protein
MDDYLSKPFKKEDLVSVLQRWIGTKPGDSAKEDPSDANPPEDQPVGGEEDCIDRKALEMIQALDLDGSTRILSKVLRLYLDDSPVLLSQLEAALRERELREVSSIAHRLKSSSAQVGAKQLSTFCQELESSGKAQDRSRATAAFSRLQKEYKRVDESLRKELQQVGESPKAHT